MIYLTKEQIKLAIARKKREEQTTLLESLGAWKDNQEELKKIALRMDVFEKAELLITMVFAEKEREREGT